MKTTRLTLADLNAMLTDAWRLVVTEDVALRIARVITRVHLRRSPGVHVLAENLQDLKCAISFGAARPIVIASDSRDLIYDLQGMPGIVYLPTINDFVRESAMEHGIGVAGINNTGGVRTLDSWILELADVDCIGVFMWNGGPYVAVPFGGREPFFGTNPLAFSIPTDGAPIVADMATSEIAFSALRIALANHMPLGVNQGLDQRGKLTFNAAEVIVGSESARLLPMGGGAKGSALMLLIEVLTGALVGGCMGREASDEFRPEEFGGLLLALHVPSFVPIADFRQRVGTLARSIRRSLPADGIKEIRLPGDVADAREREALALGVTEIDHDVLIELREVLSSK